jgi:hypothetical protein
MLDDGSCNPPQTVDQLMRLDLPAGVDVESNLSGVRTAGSVANRQAPGTDPWRGRWRSLWFDASDTQTSAARAFGDGDPGRPCPSCSERRRTDGYEAIQIGFELSRTRTGSRPARPLQPSGVPAVPAGSVRRRRRRLRCGVLTVSLSPRRPGDAGTTKGRLSGRREALDYKGGPKTHGSCSIGRRAPSGRRRTPPGCSVASSAPHGAERQTVRSSGRSVDA